MTEDLEKAYTLAKKARLNSYSPYSKYAVGAAVKATSGERIFAGCNVENASYGATICAERNAIWSLIAESGQQQLDFLVLVTDNDQPATPCALCLQVIKEFCHPEMKVYLANLEGIKKELSFKELLPLPFDSSFLPEA
jgi:cytidine deaminase